MDITKNREFLEINSITSKRVLNPAIKYVLFLSEVITESESRNETIFEISLDTSKDGETLSEDAEVIFPKNINLLWYVGKNTTVNAFNLLEERANQVGERTLAQILALEILSKASIELEIRTNNVEVEFVLSIEGENGRLFETDTEMWLGDFREIFLG